MSITGSLSNALSGLAASSRAAELVSSNVANAMTPGYGRRELVLSPNYTGGSGSAGVLVRGVQREVDMGIVQDRRLADAAVAKDGTRLDFFTDMQSIVGTPEDAGSLSGRIAGFEASLIEATSRPDSESRLAALFRSATALTDKLNTASEKVQDLRMQADSKIGIQVEQLNTGLQRVQELNYSIKEAQARGQDISPLLDQRQSAVDSISAIVPMRQVERDHGMIALYTTGGAIVLDGRAGTVEFDNVGVIVPEMTIESGALSGLTINGKAVRTEGDRSPIGGGSLAALFEVRDELGPQAQARLDAVARDLIERFEDPAVDATRAVGAAGLFTDGGAALNTANEVALSSRISINALVDPSQGGALWRLRDGLGAVTAGDAGNSQLLHTYSDALTTSRVAASGDFLGVARSASGLSGDFLSVISADLSNAEGMRTFALAQQDTLSEMEASSGVDTDYEMQKLMLIEQAYAANARVISTVGAMIDSLMEI